MITLTPEQAKNMMVILEDYVKAKNTPLDQAGRFIRAVNELLAVLKEPTNGEVEKVKAMKREKNMKREKKFQIPIQKKVQKKIQKNNEKHVIIVFIYYVCIQKLKKMNPKQV